MRLLVGAILCILLQGCKKGDAGQRAAISGSSLFVPSDELRSERRMAKPHQVPGKVREEAIAAPKIDARSDQNRYGAVIELPRKGHGTIIELPRRDPEEVAPHSFIEADGNTIDSADMDSIHDTLSNHEAKTDEGETIKMDRDAVKGDTISENVKKPREECGRIKGMTRAAAGRVIAVDPDSMSDKELSKLGERMLLQCIYESPECGKIAIEKSDEWRNVDADMRVGFSLTAIMYTSKAADEVCPFVGDIDRIAVVDKLISLIEAVAADRGVGSTGVTRDFDRGERADLLEFWCRMRVVASEVAAEYTRTTVNE